MSYKTHIEMFIICMFTPSKNFKLYLKIILNKAQFMN